MNKTFSLLSANSARKRVQFIHSLNKTRSRLKKETAGANVPRLLGNVNQVETIVGRGGGFIGAAGVQALRTQRLCTKTNRPIDTTMSVPGSNSEQSPYVVGHDEAQKMFYIRLSGEQGAGEESIAKLEYEWVRPGLVDLWHTEVPPACQGKGIAKLIVVAGLNHFCEQDVLIRPTCTYVQRVLKQNMTSRYKDHLEEAYWNSLENV